MSWGGKNPLSIAWKVFCFGLSLFFFSLKQQVNACSLFLQGLLAFRHSRFFPPQLQSEENEQCCTTGVLQILLYCSSLPTQWYKNTLSDSFQATRMLFSGAAHLLPFSLCWFTGCALLLMSRCSRFTHWSIDTNNSVLCKPSPLNPWLISWLPVHTGCHLSVRRVLNLSDEVHYCMSFALPLLCFVIEDFWSWEQL